MNAIASCAEGALHRHEHPALRLSELLDVVAARVDRTLDVTRLRAALEAHPDRFRILDPWQGPWRAATRVGRDASGRIDAWVIAVSEPTEPPPGVDTPRVKLRESVRWLGRGIDPRSRTDVSRWYAIALAERAVRRSVAKRAA